jgi:hypothetical protein
MNQKQAPAKQAQDYRGLADRVRGAAHRVSNERERAELLARAKMWDFLADHFPHRPALNKKVSYRRQVERQVARASHLP